MRRLSLLPAVAAGLLLSTAPVAAEPETVIGGRVESLLDFARDRHPEYAALRREADAAGARVEPAGALPDPVMQMELRDVTNAGTPISPSLLPNRIPSTRYAVTQTLPWFGKRDLRRDLADAGAQEATAKARAGWIELATRIKLTYVQHHVHLNSIRVAQENLDRLQRVAEIARTRYASGIGTQQDALRAQAEILALQTELIALEGESAQASARMRALLGRPQNVRLLPPETLRAMPGPAALDSAALEERVRSGNPLLAAEGARIAGAGKARALAERNRYPDVTVGLAPTQVRNGSNTLDVLLEMNIPLQRASRREQEREAEFSEEAARLRREALLNQALADLAEGLAGMDAAKRLETLVTGSLLPQAELNLGAALAGYETGRVDFAAVLDAQRQLRKARLELLRARTDQQLRLADIERLVGGEL